jgi:gluconate 2-dehydrogenase gamma chain
MQEPKNIARRRLFQAAGAGGLAAAIPIASRAQQNQPPRQPQAPRPYAFLKPNEAAFIEPAVERLIPADENGPGAHEAGVAQYIDMQLAGAWGAGERLYRAGPWNAGSPSQGYQLPFTPAELFRNALRAIEAESAGKPFSKLAPEEQDRYLDGLQKDKRDLGGVPANVFFESLLEVTIEGFFSDPVYGGNRDMAGWKLVGFPGAYANYYAFIDRHGLAFNEPPTSLAQDGAGRVHIHVVKKEK